MKKQYLVLSLVLAGVALCQTYLLKKQWQRYRDGHNLASLRPQTAGQGGAPKSGDKQPEPPNYSAIVDNHLFVADRNSVIPPELVAPEARTLGPKPFLMGIMTLSGEEVALMISADPRDGRDYRRLKVGESINEYRLMKILDQRVVMKANGKDVEVRLNEPAKLVARDLTPSAPTPSGGPQVTTVGTTGASSGASSGAPTQSVAVPAGTIVGGKKKVVVASPFGPMETWVDAK
ncbi:MAG: hypothetical protein L0387_17670 [Acidobacteria bacterium]|nr:hypothetical protein [Acidobacteriota bacterium]MCI0623460.1 hypothetical protein [Acidobacteriota bacterium]MCI0724507.1 hypothetical protein [Acidobacteriota bacterium]